MAEVADNLKKIQLDAYHRSMGAKMVPFAGFDMPVQYAGVNEEHRQVREGVGVFDVSHMGEFVVSGKEALNLIQHITSNDASKLYDGKVQYSCFPNKDGGIVDDLLVYKFTDEQYLLVVNASNIEKDWNWIKENNTFDAKVEDKSDDYTLLAVQGPKAIDVVQPLTDLDLGSMKYYTFQVGTIAGQENILISTTGYTGAGGFEIYIRNEAAEDVWKALYEEGKKHGLAPIGLAARDTLRLEMGFCLYGNDIDDTTSPIEAGLGWITKFSKDFINKPQLQKQKEDGVDRKLVGFELIDRGIPRKGYDIVDSDGTKIGVVTSGTMSPSLGKAIGMGYVMNSHKSEGSEIGIQIRNKTIAAKVVALPFYKG